MDKHTVNNESFFEPRNKCPYRRKCSDYPMKCGECKHNTKKSYFEPEEPKWGTKDYYTVDKVEIDEDEIRV